MSARNGATALAAGVILLWAGASRAEFKTQSLTLPAGGLSGGAYNMSLEGQGDAETVDVWRRGWGWGGHRGYGWGGYRGWGWGGGGRSYYGWGGGWGGGYRSYYGWGGGWGGYGSYYGWGGYRPYYGGSYYYPRYFGYNFYQPYYYPSYYYYTPFCSLTPDAASPAQQTQSNFAAEPQPQQYQPAPYDGGPANPVPMPMPQAEPKPADGKTITLQAKSTPFAYPAYGERVEPTRFAQDRR